MGLFKRRRKKSEKNMDEILEQVAEDVLSPEDRGDTHKVQHYVLGHCEQIIETAKELEEEKSEYRVVTAYLKDIQIMDLQAGIPCGHGVKGGVEPLIKEVHIAETMIFL